ncbi:MAG: FAD-linked oxidase C-terminal domain-containing protein [Syntrophotaleaceae bacterium]
MKGVVGYDLTKLLVGSEGTLGVITKIILRLLPLPAAKKTMLVLFDSIDGVAQAAAAIIGGKITPTTLDHGCHHHRLRTAGSDWNRPEAARAVLIIEVDGDSDLIEKQAKTILQLVEPLGVVNTCGRQQRRERSHLAGAAQRLRACAKSIPTN